MANQLTEKESKLERDIDERPYHSRERKEGYRPFIYGKDLKWFTKTNPKDFIYYGRWLAEPRDEKFFEGDRIYSRKILGNTLIVTIEKENSIADQQVYITKPLNHDISIYSLAAILGSKLMSFFIRNYFDEVNDAFPQIKVGQLKSLPIEIVCKNLQIQLDPLVDQLLRLNAEKSEAKLPDRLAQLQSRIDYCEERINRIVYGLYGLTEEEIAIVERR